MQFLLAQDEGKYNPERKYSQPRIKASEKFWIMGRPDPAMISTSYVERLNASTRLHVKRLNRLTLKDIEALVPVN